VFYKERSSENVNSSVTYYANLFQYVGLYAKIIKIECVFYKVTEKSKV